MEDNKPKVCVIGAGPTGLVVMKYLKEIAEVKCYELKDQIGGLWVYTDQTDTERHKDDKFYELYGTVHESIYQDLTTIIPIHFFAFKDFPPKVKDRVHFTHQEVLEYLQDYAQNYQLHDFITFNTQVVDVSQNSSAGKDWIVKLNQNEEISEEEFDYVIVCNGHNSVPYMPSEGIEDLEKFEGKVLHAHNFRKPDTEDFISKNILMVGTKYSGMDILYQLLDTKNIRAIIEGEEPDHSIDESGVGCNKIILSSPTANALSESDDFKPYKEKGTIITKTGRNLKFTKDSVIFEDGTEEKVDTILFSTGYRFKFPFIQDPELISYDCGGRYFGPLYQRTFSIKSPSLMFIGVNDSNVFNQILMERQVAIIKYYIEGKITLPSKDEMIEHSEKDKESITEAYGLRNYYKAPAIASIAYIKELREMLESHGITPAEENKDHFKTLWSMIMMIKENLPKHNFISFKTYDYKSLVPDSYKFDTSEFF